MLPQGEESDNFTLLVRSLPLAKNCETVRPGDRPEVGRPRPVERLDRPPALPEAEAGGMVGRAVAAMREGGGQRQLARDRVGGVAAAAATGEEAQRGPHEQQESDHPADRVAGEPEDERARTVGAGPARAEPERLARL